MNRRRSFLADERGAVAFEMPIVYLFIIMSLLFPLTDVAAAGFRFISAWQALRAFGQSLQYSLPPDVTSASSWINSAISKADPNYPISNFQLKCGNGFAVCSVGNSASPKYYSYSTSITLAPIVLTSVLCNSGNCTYTLSYTEQFQ